MWSVGRFFLSGRTNVRILYFRITVHPIHDWVIDSLSSIKEECKHQTSKNDSSDSLVELLEEIIQAFDLEWDKEPAMRTQAPLCLSADIYEDSQTTLPCVSASHFHRGHISFTFSLSIKSWACWLPGVLHVPLYPLTYWTLSEPQDGCQAWNGLGWKQAKQTGEPPSRFCSRISWISAWDCCGTAKTCGVSYSEERMPWLLSASVWCHPQDGHPLLLKLAVFSVCQYKYHLNVLSSVDVMTMFCVWKLAGQNWPQIKANGWPYLHFAAILYVISQEE